MRPVFQLKARLMEQHPELDAAVQGRVDTIHITNRTLIRILPVYFESACTMTGYDKKIPNADQRTEGGLYDYIQENEVLIPVWIL